MPLPAFVLPLLMAGSAVAGGIARMKAGKLEAQGARNQAFMAQLEGKQSRLRGVQIAERAREDLNSNLATVAAIRAGRGLSADSATARAIERRTVEDSYRDEGVAVLAELNRAGASDMQRQGYMTTAKWARPLATIGAIGSFLQAGSYAAGAFPARAAGSAGMHERAHG